MRSPSNTLPDYQREFSPRNIKNYISLALLPIGTQGLSSMLFSTYLSYVYVNYLGVNAAVIGLVMSVGIVVDGVTDFLMGIVTDRVRTKWGKARHWFFVSCLPVAVSMVLMFMIPESAGTTAKVVWAFLWYNIFCTLLTTVRLPGAALIALASDSSKVRNNLSWCYEVMNPVASSILGWITAPILTSLGPSLATYRIITLICAVVTMVSLLLIGVLCSEQRTGEDWKVYDAEYRKLHKDERKESLSAQLRHLFQNKWWVVYQLFQIFNQCGIFFIFGVMAYWLDLVLGDGSQVGILFTVLNIPTIIGCILYVFVARFFKTKHLLLGTLLLQFLCALTAWIAGANAWTVVLIALAVKSFVGGLGSPAVRTIIPQIIDYGEWKTGSRQEGLANAGTTVMTKIISAAASAAAGFVLAAAGFTGEGAVVAANAVSQLNFLFLGIPCITIGIAFVVFLFFRLTETDCERYRAEIEARKKALNAETP